MSTEQSSIFRDVTGFIVGGLAAGTASALTFLAFFPLPPDPTPTDHAGSALAGLILVTCLCGGVIGRRGISADYFSDLVPSVIGSYAISVFLCITARLDWTETTIMVGFVSIGITASIVVSLLSSRWFPLGAADFKI